MFIRVPCVGVCQVVRVFLFLLILRMGCGILLYKFLSIAFIVKCKKDSIAHNVSLAPFYFSDMIQILWKRT